MTLKADLWYLHRLGAKMRKVLIATPSHDGAFPAEYVDSLFNTIELMKGMGVAVSYAWVIGDSIVQKARDKLFAEAVKADLHSLVFIDGDTQWNPADFARLIEYRVDIVGAMIPKKQEKLELCFGKLDNPETKGDLIECSWIGMGLTRFSRKAIDRIWTIRNGIGANYTDGGIELRSIFTTSIYGGAFVGEDVSLCREYRAIGGRIWVDTMFRAGHIGRKVYTIA